MKNDKPFSPARMARELGITVKYAYDLLHAGRIPSAVKSEGLWQIPSASVRLLQKARRERTER